MTFYRKRAPCASIRAKGLFFFLLPPVAAIVISGCATRNFSEIRPGIEGRGHYIEGVPFYRQQEYSCGPAALASVLAFWGRPANLEQITAAVYIPKLRGTLPMDMENFMRDAGFETFSAAGTLEEVKTHIRAERPVICMLDLGFGLYRQPHYVTVLGFDDVNALLIVHDGLQANRVISYDAFKKEWSRAGFWMLAVRPQSPKVVP
ncbi:MAG TPA: C39 family peptidase [Nitrospirota bacterium]|nr:C39 family peptidase [Nitrospirota bacterium]